MKKFVWKIIYLIICILLIEGIIYFASNNIEIVEFIYSQNIYLRIVSILSYIFNTIPISTGEVFLVLLFVLIIVKLVLILRNFSIKKLANYVLNILILFVTLQLMFWSLWGINNYRYPLSDLTKFEPIPSTTEDLEKVCVYLVSKTNDIRSRISENNNGISYIPEGYKYVFENSELAFDYASDLYTFIPKNAYSKPKAMLGSEIMCHLNYTGIYNPFTNEANINVNQPDFKIPFTVCHEIAHQIGYSKENEANFISFLTCINSNDIYFEYSGYLSALVYCTNALYRADKDKYKEIRVTFSESVNRDLKYLSDFWSQYKGKTAEVANKSNDRFLKSTNQPQGVKSYGLVVDLLIAYYKDLNHENAY